MDQKTESTEAGSGGDHKSKQFNPEHIDSDDLDSSSEVDDVNESKSDDDVERKPKESFSAARFNSQRSSDSGRQVDRVEKNCRDDVIGATPTDRKNDVDNYSDDYETSCDEEEEVSK